ncbi:hypothetical protein EDB84DRAFT_1567349 [Lactarius hengduanensis]|nr:hypothetical protein EDB84DRAFT_1567349 [Lactarius hengduanensis]
MDLAAPQRTTPQQNQDKEKARTTPPPQEGNRLEEDANDATNTEGRHPGRNHLDKYTDGPLPPVQDATPSSVLDHIDIDLLKEWEVQPGEGKLIAVPFDTEAKTPEEREYLCNRILTAIAEITKCQDASVATPKPSAAAADKNLTPKSFLVYNLSNDQVDLVLQRKVWSSRAITFRATRFATVCPNFMFAIRGLGTISVKAVYPIVKQVWKSNKTKVYAQSLADEAPEDEQDSVRAELDHVLNTMNIVRLDIKEAGNVLKPRFNVHADCSNVSYDRLWSRLRAFLRSQKYSTSLEGHGTTEKTAYVCSNCHGVDHPRGLCPFPEVLGWNGPKRESNGDTPNHRNGGNTSTERRYNSPRFNKRN